MKVVLVKPWGEKTEWWKGSHMVGLVYLAGHLRSKGLEVSILDARFLGLKPQELKAELSGSDTDVIGVTSMTHEIPKVRTILRWVKGFSKDIWTFLGGPHSSGRPVETLQEIQELDFVVCGEGELPFAAALERLESGQGYFEGIEGLSFRNGNEVIYNGPQSKVIDLAEIPQPAVDLYYKPGFFANNREGVYYLNCSRGCPFRCAYCSKLLGRKVRWRTPEAITDEWIRAIREFGAQHVSVIDSIFFYH